jgi:cell wall-associated protease
MYNPCKYIFAAILSCSLLTTCAVAQTATTLIQADPPKNWHELDFKADGFYGISLNQAYAFLKGKKSKTVLVAIIDTGVDTTQKDLDGILWVNPKEKPNGKDDNHNGYVDDIHGWNFLGGKNGKCDLNEVSEEIRTYYKLKDKYANITSVPAGDEKNYAFWLKVKALRDTTVSRDTADLRYLKPEMNALMISNGYLKKAMKLGPGGTFNMQSLDKINAANDTVKNSKYVWDLVFQQEGTASNNVDVLKDLGDYIQKLNNDVNPDLTSRKDIVGDDPDVNDGKPYGNNILKYSDAAHGTGVAGLIGAKRNNGYGIDGVADNVRIMVIKALPIGDEYDKDVANAIRYAVDNGAKIINMSFGKKLSPHKEWVDEAFKYAAAKDVLLVQASGNDNLNVDSVPQYPNDTFLDGSSTDAANVICVGASGPLADTSLACNFTNYGKKNVDVFAPGTKVTSINMDSEFNTEDGTSFSSPIATGIAALVLEYYPKLSAAQLKQVILQSATPLTGTMVIKPGTHQLVDFTTLSKTGGIVNAYRAVEIAAGMKGDR